MGRKSLEIQIQTSKEQNTIRRVNNLNRMMTRVREVEGGGAGRGGGGGGGGVKISKSV